MIDPKAAGLHLRRYFATATDAQILEDTLRDAPKMAAAAGITEAAVRRAKRRGRLRGWASSLTRSVQRLLS